MTTLEMSKCRTVYKIPQHLQPLSLLVKDPRPPLQSPFLPERPLDGGHVVREGDPEASV